jgi:toxin ParE1/3/4
MANRYNLTEPAGHDLKEIWKNIAENNPNAADKFMRGCAKKFQLLADNPKIGRTKDSFIFNLRTFPYKDYVIFYFPTK